jgi:hypothetical protein
MRARARSRPSRPKETKKAETSPMIRPAFPSNDLHMGTYIMAILD